MMALSVEVAVLRRHLALFPLREGLVVGCVIGVEMIEFVRLRTGFLAAVLKSRAGLQAENLTLRRQLCVYQLSVKRPNVLRRPVKRINRLMENPHHDGSGCVACRTSQRLEKRPKMTRSCGRRDHVPVSLCQRTTCTAQTESIGKGSNHIP